MAPGVHRERTLAGALAAHRGRAPNFDAVRLGAAALVVFSHAFIV